MFAVLAVVILIELVRFGGVLPETWFAVAVLWPLAAVTWIAIRAVKGESFDAPFAILALVVLTAGYFVIGAKFAGAMFAGVWAWTAVRSHPRRVTTFLHVLLLIGVLEAVLGIAQRFVSPGWILGYYRNEVSAVSGTLINRNNYAGLMGMLAFVPFGLAHTGSRENELARAYLYLWASALMALALVCSLSRMGVAAFAAAVFLVMIVMRSGKRRGAIGRTLGWVFVGLVVAGMVWLGVDSLVARYSTLVDSDKTVNEARPILFRDTARMIIDRPWGVGAGNYADAFRRYQTTRLDLLFDHAHNDYLETAAEWGILPAALFWGAIAALLARSIRLFRLTDSTQDRGILLASIGAAFMLMIHGLADFNLQIPVNATLFFILLGICAAPDKHA